MQVMILRRILLAAVGLTIAVFALLAGGCNTVSGVGQDVAAAGQTLSDWAGNDAPKK